MKDGKTWHDLVNEVVLSREQLVTGLRTNVKGKK